MNQTPTYSAPDIRDFCLTLNVDYGTFKTIADLIEEELHLYSTDDLVILCQASMIMFTRVMLAGVVRMLEK